MAAVCCSSRICSACARPEPSRFRSVTRGFAALGSALAGAVAGMASAAGSGWTTACTGAGSGSAGPVSSNSCTGASDAAGTASGSTGAAGTLPIRRTCIRRAVIQMGIDISGECLTNRYSPSNDVAHTIMPAAGRPTCSMSMLPNARPMAPPWLPSSANDQSTPGCCQMNVPAICATSASITPIMACRRQLGSRSSYNRTMPDPMQAAPTKGPSQPVTTVSMGTPLDRARLAKAATPKERMPRPNTSSGVNLLTSRRDVRDWACDLDATVCFLPNNATKGAGPHQRGPRPDAMQIPPRH